MSSFDEDMAAERLVEDDGGTSREELEDGPAGAFEITVELEGAIPDVLTLVLDVAVVGTREPVDDW